MAGVGEALDGSLSTIFSEFKLLRDVTGVMRSSSTFMRLMPHEGASKNVNNYGRVVASEVADGVDIVQAQQLSDATTTYTPGEVAVQVILAGSTMRRIQDPSLLQRTGRMLANAYDLKEDSDGCAQLVNFVPVLGTSGDIVAPGFVNAAVSRLMIGNNIANPEPAPKPWFYVAHPLQLGVIAGKLVPLGDNPDGNVGYDGVTGSAGDSVTTGRSAYGDEILKRGIGAMGTMFSATVKADANLGTDANGDSSGAVFSQEGVVYVQELAPVSNPDNSDKSMRGAIELNYWGSYVWGLYRSSAYGIEMLFDTTLPTS